MYSMVLMAALTTGTDVPDMGRRGGCHGCGGGCYGGCYGGMGMGYGGCGGMGMGMGMGYGGCMGMGMGYGGCGGMGMGYGGTGMSWGGGYGGYALNNASPFLGGYANSPIIATGNWGTPIVSTFGTNLNPAIAQSNYFNPASANEATLVVNAPAEASLTIDGEQTQQRSATRTFTTPSLEPGKTYTYTLRAELNRDGRTIRDSKKVEVRAGQRSEVTLNLDNNSRD